MASRSQAADKMHKKALKRKLAKDRETFGKPYCQGSIYVNVVDAIKLSKKERARTMDVSYGDKMPVIKSIECPTCGIQGIARWNKNWEAFICEKCETKWELLK
jgi:predicted RNA-binding Zn-ribbon protein involved in translation (DUF1610 family)